MKLLVNILIFYRKCISPLYPPCCRFYPSCSQYAIDAVQKYGFFWGLWKSLCRVLRCHPFNPGGYDPA